MDVFARLSPEIALDFGELKNALLKRFDMTEDDFHKKFRFSKPDESETFVQFSTRLDSYLERWIQLSRTNRTFEDLKDLFLREQFLLCCSKGFALFLKERIPRQSKISRDMRTSLQRHELRLPDRSRRNRFSTEDKRPINNRNTKIRRIRTKAVTM